MTRARRGLAYSIMGGTALVAATAIGATARGPWAGGGLVHDLAVGLGILGAAAAVHWAAAELADDPEAA